MNKIQILRRTDVTSQTCLNVYRYDTT